MEKTYGCKLKSGIPLKLKNDNKLYLCLLSHIGNRKLYINHKLKKQIEELDKEDIKYIESKNTLEKLGI